MRRERVWLYRGSLTDAGQELIQTLRATTGSRYREICDL
jgi:hypothetical protein